MALKLGPQTGQSSIFAEGTLSKIRDWETMRQHVLWGYRRYRHTGVIDRSAAALDDVTPSAEALIFLLESDKRASLRVVASDESTAKKMNARSVHWPPLREWSPSKPWGARFWRTTIVFTGDDESSSRSFIAVALFGFPIYL